MCGLVGILSSNFLMKHKDALSTLLFLDTLRGQDSTGVAAIRNNGDTEILKQTVTGPEFVQGPRLHAFLNLNDFLWIGHNRAGTVGRNIKTNAHPFSIEDEGGASIVVGAHNGTLRNKHVLIDHARFGTDSEALYNNIAVEGIHDTMPKVEGAWALTYYDHFEEEFRVLRNKERPLFYAYEKGKTSLIWASEIWMLKVACQRHNIELHEDKIFSFAEDTLYKMKAPEKMNEELVLLQEAQGGLVGKTVGFFQGRQTGTGGAAYQKAAETPPATPTGPRPTPTPVGQMLLADPSKSGTRTQASGSSAQPTNPLSSDDQSSSKSGKGNVVPIKSYKGYANKALSKTELEDMLDGGCQWCNKNFIYINDTFGWLAPGTPICKACLDGTHENADDYAEMLSTLKKALN